MKKRNFKSLSLNKKSISNFDSIIGGGTSYFSCITGICYSQVCNEDFTDECPSTKTVSL